MEENKREIVLCARQVHEIYNSRLMAQYDLTMAKSFKQVMYEYFSESFTVEIKEFNYKTYYDIANQSHYLFTIEI